MQALTDLDLEFRYSSKHKRDFLWPADDVSAWKWLNKKENWDLPRRIAALCGKKNTVIQAGGNAGLYPGLYSELFDTVITFEPDYRNFFCLSHNVTKSNVFKYQAALGEVADRVTIVEDGLHHHNSGALCVGGSGAIPQLTIDSLGLVPDLIHLDIEGYEGPALLGAKHTIQSHAPLLALEANGSGERYGWPQHRIDQLLESWGYGVLVVWEHDRVYVHGNRRGIIQ
jgi:FkbM family methyltransferase